MAKTRKAAAHRRDLYDDITNKIISELEEGRLPWVQPWGAADVSAPLALPCNAGTGRRYSGINILILWGAVVQKGYPGQGWFTYRQAQTLGGNVRKGERGETVVYADRFIPEEERKRASETGGAARGIPFLKRFTVFNAAQCEGLPEDIASDMPAPPPGMIEPKVDALIASSGWTFASVAIGPFTIPRMTLCRSRLRRRTSSRSIGIGPHCMRWGTPPATHPVWTGVWPTALAPRTMRAKSFAPSWPRPFVALRSGSSRQSGMRITSDHGWRFSEKTTAPSSRLPVRPARRLTICWVLCRRKMRKGQSFRRQHSEAGEGASNRSTLWMVFVFVDQRCSTVGSRLRHFDGLQVAVDPAEGRHISLRNSGSRYGSPFPAQFSPYPWSKALLTINP